TDAAESPEYAHRKGRSRDPPPGGGVRPRKVARLAAVRDQLLPRLAGPGGAATIGAGRALALTTAEHELGFQATYEETLAIWEANARTWHFRGPPRRPSRGDVDTYRHLAGDR